MRRSQSARAAGSVAAVAVVVFGLFAPGAPAAADTGVTYVCPQSSGYDCMPGTGYTGQTVWRSHGPGHNCVSYVAYMLERNGSQRPWEGRLGNGSDWDEHARAAGYAVDTTPTVGSIAQWDGGSGHIAYVDEVTADHIVVTEDNFSGYSSARRISRHGSAFAEAEFLHIRDLPAAPADDVLWATPTAGEASMWWGLADEQAAPATAPFRPAAVPAAVTSLDAPVPGDLDGDGSTDLVLHEPGSTTARVAWGDGRGGFLPPTPRSVPSGGRAQALVGDLDGDGADDVLWYGTGQDTDAVWWGQVWEREPVVAPYALDGTYLPAVGDLDGDGVDDVALAGPRDLPDRVIWGVQGSRRLVAERVPASGLSASARPTVGDLDGDGADDIVWSRPGPARDAVWWGAEDREGVRQSIDLDDDQEAHAGDFDGDGIDDLLLVGVDGNDDALVVGATGRRLIRPSVAAIEAPTGAVPVAADFGWA